MLPFIQVKNVTKKYANRFALAGVSLDLYPGEIITLLGANGAGKTTLSSIIASLHPPTSGDVLFKGTSIYHNVSSYRAHIGFCPQKPNFDSHLTVRQHLYFAGRYFLMDPAAIEQHSAILIQQFGLQEYVDVSPATLSGGYKQRLLIARALMHKPSLVVLDEPTIALDPHIRRQLWEIIKDLKKNGVTVLLTTHYLDEAEVLSDRVCLLNKGNVQFIDTPQHLLELHHSNKLEDLFVELMRENSK